MTPEAPAATALPGGRLGLRHGPIELVVHAEGSPAVVAAAYARARARFETVLPELVAELGALRRPVTARCELRGAVARRMWRATRRFGEHFVTPMAAVAGAVADETLAELARGGGLTRAWVNNGGDVAFLNAGDAPFRLAVAIPGDPGAPRGALPAAIAIDPTRGVNGVATSGWRGRSHSLGIADAVTLLACDAATADAAATLVANATDVDHPAVDRRPACALDPDSDLGERPVTLAVGALAATERDTALARGAAVAEAMLADGRIAGALLLVQGAHRVVGTLATVAPSAAQETGAARLRASTYEVPVYAS